MKAEIPIIVRRATSRDVEGIVEVLKSTKLANETWTGNEKWIEKSLAKENSAVFVAEFDGEIVGFVNYVVFPSLWECTDQGLITDFFVREEFRGKGVGTTLLETVVRHADEEGFGEMHVSTGWENERARRLYGKFGFTEERLLLERSREK